MTQGEANMSTTGIAKRITEPSPRRQSVFLGLYYLLTLVTGVFLVFFHGRLAFALDLVASALYISVTILLYEFSRTRRSRKTR
jgi:hypothetical protein